MSDAPAPTPLPPAEGLLARLLALRVAGILTHRYVDLKLGDAGGTLILLLQAPLIGFLIGLAFDGRREDTTIDFVLALVAVWLGCFAGCREVVKERLVFLRERRTGVPVRAYVLSKIAVLAVVVAVQCLALVLMTARGVVFESSPAVVFPVLWLTGLCAAALGLFISSAVHSQSWAVFLVPIALIPQLIFSEPVIPGAPELVERIELAMPAAWSLDMLQALRARDLAWLDLLSGGAVLAGGALGFLLLAGVCLRLQHD